MKRLVHVFHMGIYSSCVVHFFNHFMLVVLWYYEYIGKTLEKVNIVLNLEGGISKKIVFDKNKKFAIQ